MPPPRSLPSRDFKPGLHCCLQLTEVPLVLSDVPTLDLCLGKQRSFRAFHQDKRHSRPFEEQREIPGAIP